MQTDTYAYLKNNIVINVGFFEEPTEEMLNDFAEHFGADLLIPTNLNPKAVVGATFDGENFIKPKPEQNPSWVLNESLDWVPPIEKPHFSTLENNTDYYEWDENTTSWIVKQHPTAEE